MKQVYAKCPACQSEWNTLGDLLGDTAVEFLGRKSDAQGQPSSRLVFSHHENDCHGEIEVDDVQTANMLANEKESRVLSWDHENKPIGAAERPGVGIHVLLVDDITDVRESVAEGLKEMGYGVTLASSGSEALTHLKKGTFDVVISDLNMADGDGLDLRAHAREKNLPTIMISGYPEKYLPFIKEDIFLQKPFYMKELVNAIRSIKRK